MNKTIKTKKKAEKKNFFFSKIGNGVNIKAENKEEANKIAEKMLKS